VQLRGATALITGAAGGLGGPIARALADEGARLVISDLPGEALERRAAELEAGGGSVTVVPADLRDREQLAGLIQRVEEEAAPVDVLVNNAGLEMTARFVDFTEEEIRAMLDVNLLAPMELIRHVVPGMLERGRGHVVSMASLAGKITPAYTSTYGMTKAALIALTQSMRSEYVDDPVGFSAICPGFVRGAGMVEPMVDSGTEFTSTVPLTPPDVVAAAVIRAIRNDLPEVTIVHRRPIKAVLMLYELAPKLTERLMRRTGTTHVFAATTKARGRI
jgi:short-subunit dehydrogenase